MSKLIFYTDTKTHKDSLMEKLVWTVMEHGQVSDVLKHGAG